MSTHTLILRCRCGHLGLTAAAVSPAVANRVACHCSGCRTFGERTDPDGFDALGGVERIQLDPASLTLSPDAALRCVQQTRNGALRWMAACCDTPLGLTLASARVPFVGLDVARIDREGLAAPLDDVVGPLRARVNGRFDRAEAPAAKADARSLLSMLWHLAPLTWRWWRAGSQRRSPFFAGPDGAPTVAVEPWYDAAPARWRAGCR